MISSFGRYYLQLLKKILEEDDQSKNTLDGILVSIIHNTDNVIQICDQARNPENYRFSMSNRNRAGKNLNNPFSLLSMLPEEKAFYDKAGLVGSKYNKYKGDINATKKYLEKKSQEKEKQFEVKPGLVLQLLEFIIVFTDEKYTRGSENITEQDKNFFLILPIHVGNPKETQNILQLAIQVHYKVSEGKTFIIYDFDQTYKLKRIQYFPTQDTKGLQPSWTMTKLLHPQHQSVPHYFQYHRPPSLDEVNVAGIANVANIYFMVSPLIKGITLEEIIKNPTITLDFQAFGELLIKLTIELYVFHAHGMVYNDYKPSNILIRYLDHAGEIRVKNVDDEQVPNFQHQPGRSDEGTSILYRSPSKGTRYNQVTATPSRPAAFATAKHGAKTQGLPEIVQRHIDTISRLSQLLGANEKRAPNVEYIATHASLVDMKSDIFSLGLVFLKLLLKQAKLTFEDFLQKNNIQLEWEQYIAFGTELEKKQLFIATKFTQAIMQLEANFPKADVKNAPYRSTIGLITKMLVFDQQGRPSVIEVLEELITIYTKVAGLRLTPEAPGAPSPVKFDPYPDEAYSADDIIVGHTGVQPEDPPVPQRVLAAAAPAAATAGSSAASGGLRPKKLF